MDLYKGNFYKFDQGKSRISNYLIDCIDKCCLYLLSCFKHSYPIWDIFLNDISFSMNIKNNEFIESFEIQNLYQLKDIIQLERNYYSGEDAYDIIEQQIKNNNPVIVQLNFEQIEYSVNYVPGLFRELPNPDHGFLIIDIKEDDIIFFDSRDMINIDEFIPYKDTDLGIISKDKLLSVLEYGSYISTVKINKLGEFNLETLFTEMKKGYYKEKEKVNLSVKYYIIDSIKKLIEISNPNNELHEVINNNIVNEEFLHRVCILMCRRGQLYEYYKYNNDINKSNLARNSFRLWSKLYWTLMRKNIKGSYLLSEDITNRLFRILESEEMLFEVL